MSKKNSHESKVKRRAQRMFELSLKYKAKDEYNKYMEAVVDELQQTKSK